MTEMRGSVAAPLGSVSIESDQPTVPYVVLEHKNEWVLLLAVTRDGPLQASYSREDDELARATVQSELERAELLSMKVEDAMRGAGPVGA